MIHLYVRKWYALLCIGLFTIPIAVVEVYAKSTKKEVVTSHKNRKCVTIAYASCFFEKDTKLTKYPAFYHKMDHTIGVDICQLDLTDPTAILGILFYGWHLKKIAKNKEKASWPASKRDATARSSIQSEFIRYNNIKQESQQKIRSGSDFLGNLVSRAVFSSFIKKYEILDAKVDEMMKLAAVKPLLYKGRSSVKSLELCDIQL